MTRVGDKVANAVRNKWLFSEPTYFPKRECYLSFVRACVRACVIA